MTIEKRDSLPAVSPEAPASTRIEQDSGSAAGEPEPSLGAAESGNQKSELVDVFEESEEGGVGVRRSSREIFLELTSLLRETPAALLGKLRAIPGGVEALVEKIKESDIGKALDKKKFFGSKAATFVAGMATGAAVRFGVRTAVGALTGGTGYLLAGASGATAGAIIEGVKTYRRELKRIVGEEEFRKKIEASIERKEELVDKLDRYLAAAKETQSEFEGEKKRLYEELKRELDIGSVRWKQVFRGALVGAVIGGVGGAIGSYLASLAEDYFLPKEAGDSLKGELREAVVAGKDAGHTISAEALEEKLKEAADVAYAKTYERIVTEGAANLKERAFSATAERGEGLTHIARKLIHDYLVEIKSLGQETNLGRGQIVYAEDALRRIIEGGVRPGEIFTINGAQIEEVLERARSLTEEEISNLETKWTPRISEQTWEKILDYSGHYNDANNFSDAVIGEAAKQAKAQASAAAEEAAKTFAAAEPPKEVLQAKNEWFKAAWLKYVAGGAAALGAGALAYRSRRGKIKM